MHAAVTLSVPQLESLQDPLVVAAFRGWHDATGSGVAAVRYLRTELQAVEVASLDPDRFYDLTVGRPHVQLQNGERVIRWPGTRCYVARGVAAGQDVVFLAGREPSLAWRSYCDAIVEVLGALGVKRFLALGTRPALVPHTRPAPLGLADADPYFEQALGLESRATGYQGPTGIQTALAMRLREEGLQTGRLTVRVPSYIAAAGPNPKAVLALVEAFDRALGTRTRLAPLLDSIVAFDAQTESALDQTEEPGQLRSQIADMERVYDQTEQPPTLTTPSELPSSEHLLRDIEDLLRQGREDEGDPTE